MVYMYVLWAGSGDPPSPWQKVATWDGRYLRFCQSNPGSTGGSSSHTHSATNASCGTSTNVTFGNTDTGGGIQISHVHDLSISISPATVEPPYYTLSLVRVDADNFLNAIRVLPVNAVVPAMLALNESGYQRLSSADNRLIKLSNTPGLTGGNSSHVHSVSVTFVAKNASTINAYNPDTNREESGSHSHTASGDTQSATYEPPHVATRLYQVIGNILKTPANIVCFFDGEPPSPWVKISDWANRYLKSSDSNPTYGGSAGHGHGTFSATSTASTLPARTSYGSGYYASKKGHTHTVSFTVAEADHSPPYVTLIAAYLPSDLWAWSTYEKSHGSSVALAARKTRSITSQMLLIRPGSRTLDSGLVLKKVKTSQIGADTRILKRFDKPYLANIMLFKTLRMIYAASLVLNPTPLIGRTYSAGIRIVNPNLISPPNTTVIDTLLKSYVDQLDKVQRQLQLLHLRHRLDLATGADLDEIWGQAFQLPRYLNEPDDVYRKRIQLHILTILASGTKPGCEEVLGELVNDPGSVRVESEWPATVRVHFDTDRAVRNADYYRGMLEYLRTRLFAAGVNVVYHITYADLVADIVLKGTVETEFRSDLLIEQPDLETSYSGGLVSVLGQAIDFDADLYLLRRPVRQLRALIAARKALEISFNGGLACKTTHETSGEIGLVLLARARRDYSASVAHLRRGLMRTHFSGIALQRVYSVPLFGSIRLELRGGAQYSGGIRIVGGIS